MCTGDYCVFVLFVLCFCTVSFMYIYSCFVCTSVTPTATEWQLNCSNDDDDDNNNNNKVCHRLIRNATNICQLTSNTSHHYAILPFTCTNTHAHAFTPNSLLRITSSLTNWRSPRTGNLRQRRKHVEVSRGTKSVVWGQETGSSDHFTSWCI